MLFTFSLVIIITISAIYLYKPIHKYKYIFYIASLIITLALHEDGNYITYGYTGLAFFIVVMFSGVLDKGLLRKRLFQVRAEYAVMGSIFISPHMLGYLEFLLEDVPLSQITINYIFGIITIFILIPLFITSFQVVRRRLGYKRWKKLHQYSYIFYLLVGLHLITIGNDRQLIYIVLFGTYGILKILTVLSAKNKKLQTKNSIS